MPSLTVLQAVNDALKVEMRKDPIARLEKVLEKRGLWTREEGERLRTEALEEISEAARTAEAVPRPGLETIFSDVYATVPHHLRVQGEAAFELAKRRGDPSAGDGAFPL